MVMYDSTGGRFRQATSTDLSGETSGTCLATVYMYPMYMDATTYGYSFDLVAIPQRSHTPLTPSRRFSRFMTAHTEMLVGEKASNAHAMLKIPTAPKVIT